MITDSRSLCELIQKTNEPREKHVKLEVGLLREAHELGETSEVQWVPTRKQLADCLTKENKAMADMLRTVLCHGLTKNTRLEY